MDQRLQKPARHRAPDRAPGLLDAAHAHEVFEIRRFLPSPPLAPFIENYWIIHWDRRGREPYVSEVLPYPSVNITFTRGRGWITGVCTAKYTYELRDQGEVFGIKYLPGGFRPVFDRDVSTITDRELDITALFPEAGEAFRTALLRQATDEAMMAEAEALLLGHLPASDTNVELIGRIIAAVRDDRRLTTVREIAARFDLAERTLQHLFRTYVGVSPKWIIRRYRLIEAAALAETGGPHNWTAIAQALGYADQAHFTNDFTRMIGRPPTAHARHVERG